MPEMMRGEGTAAAYAPPSARAAFDPTAELPGGTVLLEASAGTGKTYSIASLVLRLVAHDGIPIDRVLVVTFTEAATGELRARLRTRLRDAAALARHTLEGGAGQPDGVAEDAVARWIVAQATARGTLGTVSERLRVAVERFDEAPVSTIHGFCQRVLREHALACGADAAAELLPDESALVDEVVRDFWARETARQSDDAVRALIAHGGLSLSALRALARAALADADAWCTPEAPMETTPLDEVARAHRAVRTAFAAYCREDDDRHVSEACEVLDAACARKVLNGTSWKPKTVGERATELNAWALTGCTGPAPERLGMLATSQLKARTNKNQHTPTHALFEAVEQLCQADATLVQAAGAAALRLRHALVAHVRTEVARAKHARGLVSYDDLLRHVRDALRAPDSGEALGAALRARYPAVLVDEFQDTDPVQWEVFRRAFGTAGHALFLIGDPKQSIFRFRGADVHAYLEARETAGDQVHALGVNRRTDQPLLAALEHAFGGHLDPFAGSGIRWSTVEAFHTDARCGVRDPEGRTLLDAPLTVRYVPEPDPKPASKGRLHRALPALVAADVVRFLDRAELRDAPDRAPRRARPSDAAVLVNTHAQATAVQAALRALGVPAVGRAAASVFASDEARDLATVLAAVLEPRGHHLRAALATDLLGIAAAEEHAPGAGRGPGDVVALLRAADGEGDAAEAASELLDRWSERMAQWRERWRGAARGRRGPAAVGTTSGGTALGVPNVMRLVRAISDDLQLPACLLALVDGERRLTNLRHVAELMHAAAVAGALGPEASLAWLRREIARATAEGARCDDEHAQQRLETDAEAVQVVTVHASKGLEYGAVWIPYLWVGPSDRTRVAHPCVHGLPGATGEVSEDDSAGGTPARALDLAPTKGGESVELDADEQFAERLRLAYVALTRARHRVTVWWARANDGERSPLAWLLHGRVADGGTTRAARGALATALARASDDAVWEHLRAWGAAHPGIAVVREDGSQASPPRWRDERPLDARAPADLRAYTGPATLDGDGWRFGSFTGLTHGATQQRHEPATDGGALPESLGDARGAHAVSAPEVQASDAAIDSAPAPDAPDNRAASEVPLADFPASAAAGICFHDLLEHHDFRDDAALDAHVTRGLDTHGFDAVRWSGAVAGALRATLGASIADPGDPARPPLQLDQVQRTRRLAELRFDLPACEDGEQAITPAALASAFAAHPGGALDATRMPAYAAALRALDFRPLRGFLTGVLDLLVEHEGRWWVIDWKSNRLGRTRADYAPAAVWQEMTAAHYVLQYHLYLLAAHRWLRWRVPGYRYERHVAGACYLFVRGIAPRAPGPERPTAPEALSHGLFTDRPPLARIEALDRLFSHGVA